IWLGDDQQPLACQDETAERLRAAAESRLATYLVPKVQREELLQFCIALLPDPVVKVTVEADGRVRELAEVRDQVTVGSTPNGSQCPGVDGHDVLLRSALLVGPLSSVVTTSPSLSSSAPSRPA